MSIYKRGRFYNYEFQYRGERIRCSTKLTNKEVARAMMAQHRTRLAMAEVGLEIKSAPVRITFRHTKQMKSDHAERALCPNLRRSDELRGKRRV